MSESADNFHPDRFPTSQLFLLAVCRIAEPVAFTSVFPYAYNLMKDLVGSDTENAALYAGFFIAAFPLAESLTGLFWGALSDQVGRKPVLLLGLGGTFVSVLVIGFSTNIWIAVLGRSIGGALNGNEGVVQIIVGELVTNPKHEPRAYAVMPFFFSVGTTLGPAVGGFFARPADAFPASFLGKWSIFCRFPYLLPNLICAAMLLITIILAYALLQETHPGSGQFRHPEVAQHDLRDSEAEVTSSASTSVPAGARLYGTMANPATAGPVSTTTLSQRRISSQAWMLILAVGVLQGYTATYVQLLPISLQAPPDDTVSPHYLGGIGGFGMSLQNVGLIMGINGIIGLFIQAIISPLITAYLGIESALLVTSTLHPIVYFGFPYLAFLRPGTWRYVGLYTWLTLRSFCFVVAYPVILILLRRATPDNSILGRVNGLAASFIAAGRTISPPVVGILENVGEKHHFSALAWWGSGLVASVGAVQSWFIYKSLRQYRTDK